MFGWFIDCGLMFAWCSLLLACCAVSLIRLFRLDELLVELCYLLLC